MLTWQTVARTHSKSQMRPDVVCDRCVLAAEAPGL